MPKFGSPSCAQNSVDRSGLNFQEHCDDPEHDQPRHQGIHDHGRNEVW